MTNVSPYDGAGQKATNAPGTAVSAVTLWTGKEPEFTSESIHRFPNGRQFKGRRNLRKSVDCRASLAMTRSVDQEDSSARSPRTTRTTRKMTATHTCHAKRPVLGVLCLHEISVHGNHRPLGRALSTFAASFRTATYQNLVFSRRFLKVRRVSHENPKNDVSRKDAKIAKGKCTRLLSSWRSLRLGERIGFGCG